MPRWRRQFRDQRRKSTGKNIQIPGAPLPKTYPNIFLNNHGFETMRIFFVWKNTFMKEATEEPIEINEYNFVNLDRLKQKLL